MFQQQTRAGYNAILSQHIIDNRAYDAGVAGICCDASDDGDVGAVAGSASCCVGVGGAKAA